MSKAVWEKKKPQVLAHLENGWSIHVALKKVGISQHGALHEEYRKDIEFKNSITKYTHKPSYGFYDVLVGDKEATQI